MPETGRSLGFWTAYAMGLGTMIAAGIFSLSGTAVAAIGSSSVISFIIAAVIAGLTAAAYSEFASIYSESGGGYLFASRTFKSDRLVYVEGVMLFLGYSATTAFYLATMGEWVHEFIYPVAPWIVAAATALLLGVLNARGTEESGSFQILVTAAKVLVLFVFIGGVFLYQPPAESAAVFLGSFSLDLAGIAEIAAMAFITFFGFSAIAASAGEIIEPRKTVPKAIAASIVTVTVLYILVIFAMVNSPIPAEVVAKQGETAMGAVAKAFLGPLGMWVIVAGAIFSMVSASNASILAASRIGYLMGREGRAFRRFQHIHQRYGTPHWAVGACIFTIISLVVVFTGLLPHGGIQLLGQHIELGLPALTGFANLNLLLPLSVVNVALVLSRRRAADEERGFSVPLVPLTPVLGIAANLLLIASLPMVGVGTGLLGIVVFFAVYAAWGGSPAVEEMMSKVSASEPLLGDDRSDADETILVPVAREDDVRSQVALADAIAQRRQGLSQIEVVYVDKVPAQIPSDAADRNKVDRTIDRMKDSLNGLDVVTPMSVEGYVSQDITFTLLQLAREKGASLVLFGYPEHHRAVVERFQHETPCDVVYSYGVTSETSFDTINIGAGASKSHRAMLPLVDAFGASGSDLHVIHVDPDLGGTAEELQTTLDELPRTESINVHTVEGKHVARGLVNKAKENGGILMIAASRDHLLKQWLFGQTPDRVVDIAEEADIPVIIYRSRATIRGLLGNLLFLSHRVLHKLP